MFLKRVFTKIILCLFIILPLASPIIVSAQPFDEISIYAASLLAEAQLIRESTIIPEWSDAALDAPIIHYDLSGNRAAYVFSLISDGKDVGYITVSANVMPNPILEFSNESAPAKSTRVAAIQTAASQGEDIDLEHPLYLGPLEYYFRIETPASNQLIEMGTNRRVIIPDQIVIPPTELQPQDPVLLSNQVFEQLKATVTGSLSYHLLAGPNYPWYRGCTPTAVANAMGYYADRGFPNLIAGGSNGAKLAAIDELANLMGTSATGWTWLPIDDDIRNYASRHGYNFSSGETEDPPFIDLINQINAYHPVVILVNDDIVYGDHSITGFGYQYNPANTTDNYMIVHDTWGPANVWVQFGTHYDRIWFDTVVPPAGLLIDTVPPISAVNPLAAFQQQTDFPVSWSGSDVGMGIDTYDLQYRDGTDGIWTNWIVKTRQTEAVFSGQNGHTYYFRSRAIDKNLNQEVYPGGNGNTFTKIPSYILNGTVLTNRDLPVMGALISSNPVGVGTTVTDPKGLFLFSFPLAGSYDISVKGPDASYNNLPPLKKFHPEWGDKLDSYLVPSLELIQNGQFETGNLQGWSTDGSLLPVVVNAPHTGDYSVQLGDPTMSIGNTRLTQIVAIPSDMTLPTLSFLYKLQTISYYPWQFNLKISMNGETLQTIDLLSYGTLWKHSWVDLSLYKGKTVTITFELNQISFNSGMTVFLDEISIGPASTGTHFLYIPLVIN